MACQDDPDGLRQSFHTNLLHSFDGARRILTDYNLYLDSKTVEWSMYICMYAWMNTYSILVFSYLGRYARILVECLGWAPCLIGTCADPHCIGLWCGTVSRIAGDPGRGSGRNINGT